jgi:hypothetical protein
MNVAIVGNVSILEVPVLIYAKPVDIISLGEIEVEIGTVVIEYAIIISVIDSFYRVENAEGAVTKGGVNLPLPGTTREH